MSFCWVTLPVKNFEQSLTFYHDILGLPVVSSHSHVGMKMAMLGEEHQPKVELLYQEYNQKEKMYSDISIGIQVKSLNETIEYLKTKDIEIIRGPISPNEHVQFAFIHDPDGYEVQLVEMKSL